MINIYNIIFLFYVEAVSQSIRMYDALNNLLSDGIVIYSSLKEKIEGLNVELV